MNRLNRYLYWNMGYHIEHHMFPMVPYHNLPKLHALVKDDMPAPVQRVGGVLPGDHPDAHPPSKDPNYYYVRTVPTPTAPGRSAADFGGGRFRPRRTPKVGSRCASLIASCPAMSFGSSTARTYRGLPHPIGQLYATAGRCTQGTPARGRIPPGRLHRVPNPDQRAQPPPLNVREARCAARRRGFR